MNGKIVDVLVAKPPRGLNMTIEETGFGDVLCMDFFLGRLFRHDPEMLRDICEKYREQYLESCERLDEDPEHQAYEVTNWNELYEMIPIETSLVGDTFGLTNDQDWRIDFQFEYLMVTRGPLVEKYGEPVFLFGPKEGCEPFECYREV